jgi:hypothetical protein
MVRMESPLRSTPRFVAYVGLVVAFAGCGGPKQDFIGQRVEDVCDQQWPICSTIAGCMLGDRSYKEGRFPNSSRVIVQLFEPSEVKLSFFIEEMGGSGTETVLNFYEDRCRNRVQIIVTGKEFIGEIEKVGYLFRRADLVGTGDHLIEFTSDARAKYTAKIDVTPLRLRDQQQP